MARLLDRRRHVARGWTPTFPSNCAWRNDFYSVTIRTARSHPGQISRLAGFVPRIPGASYVRIRGNLMKYAKVEIAPSFLPADFSRLGEVVRKVEEGGAAGL